MSDFKTARKDWNFSVAQSESLHFLFETVLSKLGTSALVQTDGTALHVRPSGPADIATLPEAATICQRYLKLRHREYALTNDPYSGGTTLSDFTLVAGISLDSNSSAVGVSNNGKYAGAEADTLLVARVPLSYHLSNSETLDHEGVRVPPMPLAGEGKINLDILKAISAHPAAPANLVEAIEGTWRKMEEAIAIFTRLARDPGTELKRANFKKYLSDSSSAFESLMLKLPLGSTIVTNRLPSGELMKLQVKFTESTLFFDFAGSDASRTVSMTELATFGACVAATVSALNFPIPMNSGLFEHIQVSTPSRTMFSSQPPAGTLKGMNEGIALTCDLVRMALANLNPAFHAAEAASMEGLFQIEFGNGLKFTSAIRPGGAATQTASGTDAYAPWSSRQGQVLDPRQIETNFPVRVLSLGLRSASGAKGQTRGGDGEMVGFQLLSPGQIRWSFGKMMGHLEGYAGGRSGVAAKIEVRRANEQALEEQLESEGAIALNENDQIFFLASGGSGYGSVGETEIEKADH